MAYGAVHGKAWRYPWQLVLCTAQVLKYIMRGVMYMYRGGGGASQRWRDGGQREPPATPAEPTDSMYVLPHNTTHHKQTDLRPDLVHSPPAL